MYRKWGKKLEEDGTCAPRLLGRPSFFTNSTACEVIRHPGQKFLLLLLQGTHRGYLVGELFITRRKGDRTDDLEYRNTSKRRIPFRRNDLRNQFHWVGRAEDEPEVADTTLASPTVNCNWKFCLFRLQPSTHTILPSMCILCHFKSKTCLHCDTAVE